MSSQTRPNTYFVMLAIATSAAAIGSSATGQVVGGAPPQISQLPPPPETTRTIPDIRIQRPGAPESAGPSGVSVQVKSLRVTGETRFSEAELIAVADFTPGRTLDLSDLRRMAARITDFYSAHGYIVAQAYVPAQQIDDGVVTIVVIEGHYGAVDLHNRSRLRNSVAEGVLTGLNSNDLVAAPPLERRLLLLSDLPGVVVRSTLSPGAAVGTSDLTVDITPGRRVNGDLEVDNDGNPYSGELEGGGTINFNEPFGLGDVASVRLLTSGEGMQYARASYQAEVGDATVGAAYAYFHYRLGRQFSALDANGDEQIASLYASYPLVRSYDNNLEAQVDGDYRVLSDRIGVVSTDDERRAEVGTVGLSGDHHDTVGGGGWDGYSIFFSGGNLDIRTPLARATDAATARTEGGYAKLTFSADRLQTIAGPFSIYAAFRGQVASKNLDISEKMELGGAYAVRAYPEGEAYGDEGYVGTVEGRLRLPPLNALPGRLQLFGFYDYGWVEFSRDPWFAGPDSATRSGAGVGLAWALPNRFVVKASYAFRLGPPATSFPDSTGQFWFQVVRFF